MMKLYSTRKEQFYLLLISWLSFLLIACSNYSPPSQTPFKPSKPTLQWDNHKNRALNITHYQVRGKFAYLDKNNKLSANFYWRQYNSEHYHLILTNPFGGTEVDITVNGSRIELIDNEGKKYYSRNAEQLLTDITGLDIPLNNIRLWLLGLPGNKTLFELNQDNLIQQLIYQRGNTTWHVIYQNYKSNLALPLPEQLNIFNDDLLIKLKINDWIL